jgi:hypothetical protein
VNQALDRQARTNGQQVARYQELAVRQARASFLHGQAAMAVALGILVAGAWTVMHAGQGTGQIVLGGLTAMGSLFSAFLGRTFIDARHRAIDQLNRSYALPLTKDLLWFAAQLGSRVGGVKIKDELTREVVLSAVRAAQSTPAVADTPSRRPGLQVPRKASSAVDKQAGS